MADNSILPKASAPLVDQTGRPTRAFYTFFNALVSSLQGQINAISKLVKNLALVIAALGGDPDSGEGIPDISGQIDAKADKAITITGMQSIQGGGDLSQNRFIYLDGDVDDVPGVSFYGSPDGNVKGWTAFSANFTPSMDADDNVTLDLVTVEDAGGGTLQRTAFDAYGRKTGTSAATTTDLTEGANLYFTDERAQAAVVVSGITDGDTDHSPSGDAVFDALALKIDSSEKAAANGVATLGADAKLDPGQLPALAITETFVVDDETEMLALDCEQGDVAVRTDLSKSFILTADPPSTLTNWQELLTPTGGVSSFNGRTGSVTPASGDYTPAQVGAEAAITAGTTAQYWRGDKSWQTLNKSAAGLGNVDNTSDADKPVSTAQAVAISATLSRGALIYLIDGITVATDAAALAVDFDAVSYDDAAWFSEANPSRLTVPAGVSRVRVCFSAGFNSGGGGWRFGFLSKNGSPAYVGRCGQRIASSGGVDYINASTGIIKVSPGDYFQLLVQQTSGADLNLRGSAAGSDTWMSIEAVPAP